MVDRSYVPSVCGNNSQGRRVGDSRAPRAVVVRWDVL
jgi:hypothetical protein